MKEKIIIISILVLFAIGAIVFFNLPKEIKNIKKFRFTYTNGNQMNSNVLYEVYCGTTKCAVTVKLEGETDEEAFDSEVSLEEIDGLIAILNKYNISRWNGFKRYNKNVLDGNSFSMSVYSDNLTITASGYMNFPMNYKKVKAELDTYFNNLRK